MRAWLPIAVAIALLVALATVAAAQPDPAAPPPPRAQPVPAQPGQPGQPPTVRVQPGQPGQPGQPPTVRVQPGNPTGIPQRPPRQVARPDADAPTPAVVAPEQRHKDIYEGVPSKNSPWLALAFWLFALATIGGAIFVITRRNLIAAVMGMVGAFFGVSAVYMLLYASFLAVIQLLVYAGAIMVLFVFVIMILNRPEDEPWGPVGVIGKGIAALGLLYLGFRLVVLVWGVEPSQSKVAAMAPPPVTVTTWKADPSADGKKIKTTEQHDFGSTKAVGDVLFGPYLFPFEAISILLLVSVVGAIAVARPFKAEKEEAAS